MDRDENRHRALFEFAPVGLVLSGVDGRIRAANEAAHRLLGYEAGGLVGRSFKDLSALPTELFDGVFARRMAELLGAGQLQFLTQLTHRSGEARDVHVEARVFPVEESEPEVLSAWTDVTAERRTRAALEESERWLQASQRVARIGHFDFILAEDRWRTSPVLDEVFGIDAVFDRTAAGWLALVRPDQREGMASYLRSVLSSGERFDRVYPILDPRTGEERWVHGLAELRRDAAGLPSALVGTIQDVTERHRAEHARTRSEARLRRLAAAVEQAPVSIVITDTSGRIEYVNPAFERTTGWTAAESIGQNPRILKSDKQCEAFYRQLWATISAGRTWTGRFVNRAKGGREFTEVASISPVRDEAGIICHYVAVKRDVTQELALEAQLTQAQKMESIGRLAGGVAHDFNNLLTVILTSTSALKEGLEGSAGVLREDVEEIHQAALRARDLTRQLLAFARKQPRVQLSVDLGAVVRGSEKLLRRMLGEDVEVAVSIATGLWPILGDVGQFEQVLMNLAVNARDALPSGGRIEVACDNLVARPEDALRLGVAAGGEYVRLAFRDDGVGMPPAILARLFEPFFTTKDPGRGTGLGLSSVHGIVKQNDGHVRVESAPGQGTRFELCFPRVAGQVHPGRLPAAAPGQRGSEALLVVEDDRHVRDATVRVLRDGGYQVQTATDGREGLALASAFPGPLDLVVTDVVMPGLDGRSMASALRQRRPGQRVLFVSGHPGTFLADRGSLEVGSAFLDKPFTPEALLAAVREALTGPPAERT